MRHADWDWALWEDWDWGWHHGNVMMRGWGIVFFLAAFAVLAVVMWRKRGRLVNISIDHPDEVIHWFACYPEAERKRVTGGPCPHDCPHNQTAVVGWGPDYRHYELVRCDVAAGCNRECRGWCAAAGASSHELHGAIRWLVLLPSLDCQVSGVV